MTDPPHITIGLKEIFVQIQELADLVQDMQGDNKLVVHKVDAMRCTLEKHSTQIETLTSRPYIAPAAVWTALGIVVAAAGVVVAIIK